MVYLLNLADQTRLFLYSLGFGFALGILYDVFRVIRLLVAPKGKRFYLLAQDIIYSLICTILSFYFFLAAGDGALRGYCLIGLILGWLVYYVSLGAVALRLSEWLVRQIRRFLRAFVRLLASPFLRFLRFLEKSARHARKLRISMKFIKKNLRFGLQSTPGMVYNVERSGLFQKKEQTHLAKQPQQAKHSTTTNPVSPRAPGRKTGRAKKPRHELPGAGHGTGVRAYRGVPYLKQPRGHGRRRRAKR